MSFKHAVQSHWQTLCDNARLLPGVVRSPTLLWLWLRSARKAQIAAAIALVLLLALAPPALRTLADALYPPVKVEKKLLGLIKTGKTSDNPLRERRYSQFLFLTWLLGLAPAGVLLINHLPRTLRLAADQPEAPGEATQMRLPAIAAGEGFIGAGQRYRLHGMVARGGMGEVHLAFDQRLQRQVAAKMLAENLNQDTDVLSRFNQEALALAKLSHPNIVSVLDLFEDHGQFWFIMELLPGGDLSERIRAGAMEEKEALRIVRAIADGLAYAHDKGIIHRDIKPGNILFSDTMTAKLTDFGIAKLTSSDVVTQLGLALGSPSYMSPEQAAGQSVDARSDLYALGVTLYQMVTGELPFRGETTAVMSQHITQPPPPPGTLNAALSADVEGLILQLMAKVPEQRPASARALCEAIDRLL
jgi:tRNA A-37 threonylcarbamoyl transferase component Bud32